MARPVEVLTECLREHPAVQAWSRVHPDSPEPDSIETLKCHKRKSEVYRLHGLRNDGKALIAKRCRRTTGVVERMIYQELLPRLSLPALRCYGLLEEPGGDACWLFLEDAAGEAYSPQLAQHRALGAEWLGELHLAAVPAGLVARLPGRDPGYYRQRLLASRARLAEFLVPKTALSSAHAAVFREVVAHFDAIESRWSRIEALCDVMPRTVVHGDFVAKNLRVRNDAARPALLVYDWELAGWGPAVIDLAQSVDFVASPDLALYCAVVRREWPRLGLQALQRAAACGKLLRLVDQVHWVTSWLQSTAYLFVVKPAATLQIYEADLSEALRSFDCEGRCG